MTDLELKGLIAKYLKIRVKKHKDVIKATGISETTYYRKMDHPENFKLKEIRAIFDYLKIPLTERQI